MISPTTKYVQDFIDKIKQAEATIPSNELFGEEIRNFILQYNPPRYARWWFYDILMDPPVLEMEYFNDVIILACKKVNNRNFGGKLRTLTREFWEKPGHTLLYSKFNTGI